MKQIRIDAARNFSSWFEYFKSSIKPPAGDHVLPKLDGSLTRPNSLEVIICKAKGTYFFALISLTVAKSCSLLTFSLPVDKSHASDVRKFLSEKLDADLTRFQTRVMWKDIFNGSYPIEIN
jgi:hypothetical protein